METDKTTLEDLSIFDKNESFSFFNKLDRCTTSRGREQLYQNFYTPLNSLEEVNGVQDTLRYLIRRGESWTGKISNGTIMVIEKFYESAIDEIPAGISAFSALSYKLFHSYDFSLVKYSAQHCFDFIRGMQQLVGQHLHEHTPAPMKMLLEQVKKIISKEQFRIVEEHETSAAMSNAQVLNFAAYVRSHFKSNMLDLIYLFSRMDAWQGMAKSVIAYGLSFPEFIHSDEPELNINGVYHLLLEDPVSYDLELNRKNSFLFLTGANMAGKSTFIKAVGSAVFLAHTGMGVPATKMKLSFFEGLLSNINVADNIAKGESYFYNEVQRVKATVTKVNNGKKWLILIDELFKGTNVQDAMKCSITVIEGLLKMKNSLFLLSTHLYEIGEELKKYDNINFKFFETMVKGEQLEFSYQLKDGISNDRLGYLILKREGVVEMLEGL